MQYVKLGSTGLEVSRVCLGCMTYGDPGRGNHEWTLDEEASRPLIRQALDAGITFFDTANVYSDGTSEEIVGRALRDFARRDDVVLATKVNGRMRPGPNGAGLSRKAIMTELDHSLRRLGTDYVDLYQIHRFDPHTPVEETMEALHDVVKAGKVRYIGASSMYAWQFSRRSTPPNCAAGRRSCPCRTTTTSSTARRSGRCCRSAPTRAWACCRGARSPAAGSPGSGTPPPNAAPPTSSAAPCTRKVTARSWRRSPASPRPAVCRAPRSPSPGCSTRTRSPRPSSERRSPGHIEDAVAAVDLELTDKEIEELEQPYTPHPIAGH